MNKTNSALKDLKARFQAPPRPDEVIGVLHEPEVIKRKVVVKEPRVQKNLSLTKSDADRLVRLSRSTGLSQAKLLSAALDCYETSLKPNS